MHGLNQTMSYEPAERAVKPRQVLATWAIFVIVLVTSGAVNQADFHSRERETLLAQSSRAGIVAVQAGDARARSSATLQRTGERRKIRIGGIFPPA